MVPVSAVQLFFPEVEELPLELTEVVVYWQVQLAMVVMVLPVTLADNVSDCETITVVDGGNTETLMTLLLLPPQPAKNKSAAAAKPSAARELHVRDFVTTRTPKILIRPRPWPNKVSELKSGKPPGHANSLKPKRASSKGPTDGEPERGGRFKIIQATGIVLDLIE